MTLRKGKVTHSNTDMKVWEILKFFLTSMFSVQVTKVELKDMNIALSLISVSKHRIYYIAMMTMTSYQDAVQ